MMATTDSKNAESPQSRQYPNRRPYAATAGVDPITVEVLRNAFNAIADEMNANLVRSAYSPIIYDMKDCSVALFNERVELLGQSPGLPIFLAALDEAVRVVRDHVGLENFDKGDVYVINDPYLTGSHLASLPSDRTARLAPQVLPRRVVAEQGIVVPVDVDEGGQNGRCLAARLQAHGHEGLTVVQRDRGIGRPEVNAQSHGVRLSAARDVAGADPTSRPGRLGATRH